MLQKWEGRDSVHFDSYMCPEDVFKKLWPDADVDPVVVTCSAMKSIYIVLL